MPPVGQSIFSARGPLRALGAFADQVAKFLVIAAPVGVLIALVADFGFWYMLDLRLFGLLSLSDHINSALSMVPIPVACFIGFGVFVRWNAMGVSLVGDPSMARWPRLQKFFSGFYSAFELLLYLGSLLTALVLFMVAIFLDADAATTIPVLLAASGLFFLVVTAAGLKKAPRPQPAAMREYPLLMGIVCFAATIFLAGAQTAIWQTTSHKRYSIYTDIADSGGKEREYQSAIPLRTLSVGLVAWAAGRVVIIPLDHIQSIEPD